MYPHQACEPADRNSWQVGFQPCFDQSTSGPLRHENFRDILEQLIWSVFSFDQYLLRLTFQNGLTKKGVLFVRTPYIMTYRNQLVRPIPFRRKRNKRNS